MWVAMYGALSTAEEPKAPTNFIQRARRFCRRLLSGAVFFRNIRACARCVFTLTYWEVQCSSRHFLPIQIHLQFFLPIKCEKTARIKNTGEVEGQLAAKLTKCLKSTQRKGKFLYSTSSPFLQTSPFLRYFSVLLVAFSSSNLSIQQLSFSLPFLKQTMVEHYNACFIDLAVS